MDYGFEYMRDEEEHTETDYPYHARDESCKQVAGKTVQDSGYLDLAQSQDALEKALTEGPVSVAVDASRWSSYRGGIFSTCGTSLNHGVLAVGYTSEYWTIKNSWGTSWGEKGFMRLAKGNTCGILQVASYPTL
jgi:C1A family cysteine protease